MWGLPTELCVDIKDAMKNEMFQWMLKGIEIPPGQFRVVKDPGTLNGFDFSRI